MATLHVNPIGRAEVTSEGMFIQLEPDYIPALEGLDGFSHLNVIWWFSDFDSPDFRHMRQSPQPYKGAPEVMGLFATRSPIRPNPLALTCVQVLHVDYANGRIQVAYMDTNDGTPILDIKPYTPSYDRVEAPGVPAWCSHWPMSIEQSGDFDWEAVFNF